MDREVCHTTTSNSYLKRSRTIICVWEITTHVNGIVESIPSGAQRDASSFPSLDDESNNLSD